MVPVKQNDVGQPAVGGIGALRPPSAPVTSAPIGGGNTTGLDPAFSTLSPNFANYVYNMMGRAEGLASLPFQEYTGQRFAGAAPLQQQAFNNFGSLSGAAGMQQATGAAQQALTGLQGLQPFQAQQINLPGVSTGLGPVGDISSYMNPYMQNVVDIQAREARRVADISRQSEQARLAQAGAYGGSRQAIMEAERQRNLGQQIGDIQEKGLQSAFDRAQQQRFQEAGLGVQAQGMTQQGTLDAARLQDQSRQFGANFGLQGLQAQMAGASTLGNLNQQQFGQQLQAANAQLTAGQQQREIAQQPLDFGYQQFQESLADPYKKTTYMQSMLQGLPLAVKDYTAGQDSLTQALSGGLSGLALWNAIMGEK